METITLSLTQTEINQLKNTFIDQLSPNVQPYTLYQIKTENCTITAYTSNKVVFQGSDAHVYAASFQKINKIVAHAGSDEVGTGDYFGSVVVCACLVKESDVKYLSDLYITDSKMLKDSYIESIGDELMKRLDHSLLILPNDKYNEIHKTTNMNAIKAKLHNQAYLHLSNKVKMPELAIVDQFAPKELYYKYLSNETTVYNKLHFETKAESKFLAVAAASVIARFAFLKTWKLMEARWKMTFTKGAGEKVDQDIRIFINKYGFNSLYHVAKVHFKNTPSN